MLGIFFQISTHNKSRFLCRVVFSFSCWQENATPVCRHYPENGESFRIRAAGRWPGGGRDPHREGPSAAGGGRGGAGRGAWGAGCGARRSYHVHSRHSCASAISCRVQESADARPGAHITKETSKSKAPVPFPFSTSSNLLAV